MPGELVVRHSKMIGSYNASIEKQKDILQNDVLEKMMNFCENQLHGMSEDFKFDECTRQSPLQVTFCQYPTNTSLPSCRNPEEKGLYHKIRICGEDHIELYIRLGFLAIVMISSLLSHWAAYHLHTISDYFQLYKKTQTFLFCFPTRPEVHRSVLFDHSNNDEKADQLKEMLEKSAPRKIRINSAYQH